MDNKEICQICGSDATLIYKGYKSYIVNQKFDIYHCIQCDTNFLSDRFPDTNFIYDSIYKQSKLIGGYNRYHYYFEQIKKQPDPLNFLATKEAMYWSVKEAIRKYKINKNVSLLEVGSGLGYLTYALSKAGYNIKGIDISKNAVDEANKNLGNNYIHGDIFKISLTESHRYDLIILNEVIEHVSDPVAFIECLVKMLTPTGKLVVTTPDKDVSDPKSVWDTELPPVHIWWFSEKSMATIAEKLSCKIEFIDFTEFNKHVFDKMRFKIYTEYNRNPSLDENGKVISPTQYVPVKESAKTQIQQIVAKISSLKLLSSLLTRKEYPIHKNSTLACVFSAS